VKIFIHYDITDEPWGGINSFFKAFHDYVSHSDVDAEIVSDPFACNIFLFGANASGRKARITPYEIAKFKSYLKCKFVHRLDGAKSVYTKDALHIPTDHTQLLLTKMADHTVFQSMSALKTFKSFGFTMRDYSIIHNGVNQNIFRPPINPYWNERSNLQILSSAWSNNINKGFKTISLMSDIPYINMKFIGRWNKEVPQRKVNILPPMPQGELAKYYREADIFLHAAENDPCPNVVLEALSCGCPILYHDSGGTPEIAKYYGECLSELESPKVLRNALDEISIHHDKFVHRVIHDIQKFSIEHTVKQYLKVFKEVLESK
jgi:glycosyltransferase involved in cell wall biosynthesis